MNTTALTVRQATEADAGTLARLAQLDEDAPLHGRTLLAELDGRPVADPFIASAGAVSLLRLRAGQLARGPSSRRPRAGLRARLA